jgi:hypothetical protein
VLGINLLKAKPKELKFSPVSAANEKRRDDIAKRIEANTKDIAIARGGLQRSEERIGSGERIAQRHNDHSELDKALADRDTFKRRISYLVEEKAKALEAEQAELEATIEAAKPAREKNCRLLLELNQKRIARICAAGDHLKTVGELLGEDYTSLTAGMKRAAAEIELGSRFIDLQTKLPELMEELRRAEAEIASLLKGYNEEGPGLSAYVVVDDEPVWLPETLVCSGRFTEGDVVWLLPSEADWVNAEKVKQRQQGDWSFYEAVVRLVPLEKYRAAEARATQNGWSVRSALDAMQREDEQKERERKNQGRPPSEYKQAMEKLSAQRAQSGGGR